ncbi:Glycoside hydrolase family 61 [Pyrenophora seminiperda CCB06]|uniref:AA9 family lytic polysaccharide monooxygenase n=1 Tax=Pyrenophora seminiperda CCB06 TaxID=1302712 RepID=A0A3M7M1W8_9PLEO|nr:Glycoside hydrolase family 61 [Pyrenophora seminiperda CCB06]
MPSAITLTAILSAASTVSAHGWIDEWTISGQSHTGYNPTTAPWVPEQNTIAWPAWNTDSGPVFSSQLQSPDVICSTNATNAKIYGAPINAGSTIGLHWTNWAESHHGPIITYLAACNGDCTTVNKHQLQWFKIAERGQISLGAGEGKAGIWAADELRAANGAWSVTIPSSLKAGNYVLRNEIIALHSAHIVGGAQLYPQCANIRIMGRGTAVPAGVVGTALYAADEPGILHNIWNDETGPSYQIPGPKLCRPNPWGLVSVTGAEPNNYDSLSTHNPILGLGEDTGTQNTKELAERWLQECKRDHEACWERQQTAPPLPRRVLRIVKNGSNTVRLCEEVKDNAPYMCLSYRWGNPADNLRTMRSNIENHMLNIPMDSLPLLFRQFIDLARFFEIDYIWIDSLCIIQDDQEDWKAEATKMASVYSNSWLTIAATAAGGPGENLFRKRETTTIESCDGSFKVQATRHFPDDPDDDTEDVFPLLKRAWVYQERLLSPRVLHFGPDEIIWDCFKTRRCECGMDQHAKFEIPKRDFSRVLSNLEPDDAFEARVLWRRIVAQYSRLHLTDVRDRLYAINGIAKAMQDARNLVSKDTYLTGLWKESFAADLLWYRHVKGLKCGSFVARQTARVPSWSWASIDGPVSHIETEWQNVEFLYLLEKVDIAISENDMSKSTLEQEVMETHYSIKLTCPSLKIIMDAIDDQFADIVHDLDLRLDHDEVMPEDELHLGLIARFGYEISLGYVALVLQARHESFVRVGYMEMYCEDRDGPLLEERFKKVGTFIVE